MALSHFSRECLTRLIRKHSVINVGKNADT